jgi:hypothetical protein
MELRTAAGSRPQDHFHVQGRWTPRWPVLDGRVPNLLEVGPECPPLLNRSRPFRAECVRLVQSALGTSQAGRAQGLAVCFLRSRHSPPEDNPPSQSMSWISYLVGRFSGVHRWPVLGVHRGLAEFRERLAKFGLELHADKTRLIEFGRFAARDRQRRGEGKPETFTFLGFTHYCGKHPSSGAFTIWRETAKKRMVAKLHAIKAELRRRMHEPIALVGLHRVVLGYYQYPCGSGQS